MFVVLGILLLVSGASLTFAIDRAAEGFDLILAGWILMAGGGISLVVGMIEGVASAPVGSPPATERSLEDGRHTSRHSSRDAIENSSTR